MGTVKIGLEVHISLNKGIKTKMFCGCKLPTKPEPNTNCCPICLAHPGAKPSFNKEVLNAALKLATALKCDTAKQLLFSRKTYFYPDLPANYQITQYEAPLGINGKLDIDAKTIALKRVHIEEDPAALIHPGGVANAGFTLIDYNRAGTPLAEVVTEPDIESPEEARQFLKALLSIVDYLGIYESETGTIKADANVSIKETGYIRVEIKNISGFKEIESALNYEIERQRKCFQAGESIQQETRGWDAVSQQTYAMRTKETEDDYGYISEPNLTTIDITDDMIKRIELPELANARAKRLKEDYNIAADDANALTADMELAELFERVAKEIDPILAAKWLRKELVNVLKEKKKKLKLVKFDETQMVTLLKMFEKGEITDVTARELLEKLAKKSFDVSEYVENKDLRAVSDTKELENYCKEAVEDHPRVADDYKAGKEEALNYLVGKVMKKTKGKAPAGKCKEIIKELIK
ncbi:MAG: Asp-tRNA(Asn)/Glu-tRNA(Gln) amidotransferase subunit GatB [Nanoarchaeota archaeon]|nr:Asp-tRNA(Asn)/Glu-tRNA(Gln) amidotransferase subunit GatB [Nanoarchaeota archaeon]